MVGKTLSHWAWFTRHAELEKLTRMSTTFGTLGLFVGKKRESPRDGYILKERILPDRSPEKTAQNISNLIDSSNLSVCDLQNLFGFASPQAIYNWKSGNSLPALDNLLKLSHFLHTPIEKIIVIEMREDNAKHDIPEELRIDE